MRISPLGPHVGAEITGIDLAQPLDVSTVKSVYDAFLEHQVLVFRGQSLTPQQYRDGLANFGEPMRQHRQKYNLEECPDVSIVTNHGGFGKADMWHTDHTNHECPPKVTSLCAVVLPAQGGSTWFADMHSGLDALPAHLREKIEPLFSINDMENNPGYSEADRQRHQGGARHPLVRTHPETGRKALYFHITKSQHIEGMDDAEVRPFLAELLDHAVRPEWVYRHVWQAGDVVMADNRCIMHRAEHDYPPEEHRLLWRVILAGDRPS
ncbi:MAG: TauD/TfdA family dioxygenase [Chromatiales bacterium]|nr:TauD/TfdA family dioxygenase [Chromatiales bacterium]